MDKILFFDIDGTLAMRGSIPKGNLEMLKVLKTKGYKTFVCTGRAVYYAKNMFHDLVTGYIACNGRYIEADDKKIHGEDHLSLFKNQDVSYYTFDLFFNQKRFNELENEFKDSLVLNNHYNGSCDCTTLNYNKGSAIEYLLNYYNIDKKYAYAFGDGANDVYMFRNAGNRIAMGNAIETLKQEATYITDDYDKEGIKKALEYYDLI